MNPGQLWMIAYGLIAMGLGALLRWRALSVARRVYRTAYWRGQSVDEVAQAFRVMSYTIIAMGAIYATLAALGH